MAGRSPCGARRLARTLLPGVVLLLAAGCGGGSSPASSPASATVSSTPVEKDRALRAELIAMQECDQGRCSPAQETVTQQGRESRLKEIIAAHGWPSYDLVGRRGGDAAWLIAQHADLDLAFQRDALALLDDAVARGQASAGNLAYLEDRVAVAEGRAQSYGTQVRCTGAGGAPQPATPIEDEATVEQRRRDAGLEPLVDYLAEMTRLCGQ